MKVANIKATEVYLSFRIKISVSLRPLHMWATYISNMVTSKMRICGCLELVGLGFPLANPHICILSMA